LNKSTELLFVYGTLKPGERNYRQIAEHVQSSSAGSTDGVLFDLGFPALIPGAGIVRGILLRVDAVALTITDRIEGVGKDRAGSLYVRREAVVSLDNGEVVNSWTYEFGNAESIAHRPRLVIGHEKGLPVHAWSCSRED